MSSRKSHRLSRPRHKLSVTNLEERLAPAAQVLSLADPNLYGLSGMKASVSPSISADGQLVAFASDADNLVPNDTNGLTDAFVFDRSSGQVTLISVGTNGYAAGIDEPPVISPDGRYVAFASGGYYLDQEIISGVTGRQLFLRDLETSGTILVSVDGTGTGGGNGESSNPVFSPNSRHVGFLSNSTNLISGISYHSFSGSDLYLRDLASGTTRLVSVSLDGSENGDADTAQFSRQFALSADGRFVAFSSSASNLVSIPNEGIEQVYLRDMATGVTQMISVDRSGLVGAGGHNLLNTDGFSLSADGRYVVFYSNAEGIVDLPVGGIVASYLRDTLTGSTVLVSASTVNGSPVASGASTVLSRDGRWTAFVTSSPVTNLPTNGKKNVYLRDNESGEVSLVSVNQAGTGGANGDSGISTFFDFPGSLSFSADGRYLAFRSRATDLIPGVTSSGVANLYARDLLTNRTILLTPASGGPGAGNEDSSTVAFSADGRVAVYQSKATNLTAGDRNGLDDVFIRDLAGGTTTIASARSPLLPEALPSSYGASLRSVSADGRFVAFTSDVFYGTSFSDLAPGVTFSSVESTSHVFVRDRQDGSIKVVDLNASGVSVGGFNPVISGNGRYVAFVGYTSLLPAGVTASNAQDLNVFVRDLQTNTTSVVNLSPSGTQNAPVDGQQLAISDDGRYVAWSSIDTSAVAGVTSSSPGNLRMIFYRDRQTGTNYLVSGNSGQVGGDAENLRMSADGRYVLFRSDDSNLAANDFNSGWDVFRWDRTTNSIQAVSLNEAGTGTGDAPLDANELAEMTPDGRYVVFGSPASDLVAGDINGFSDVFRRDTQSGTTTLVSRRSDGGLADNSSFSPSISNDGDRVGFRSFASDLTTELSGGGGPKTFVRDITAATTTLVTRNLLGESVYGAGTLSPDGRYVVFSSDRADLVPDFVDGNGSSEDIFVGDLQQGLTKLLTANESGTATARMDLATDALSPHFSRDGRSVLFDSDVPNFYIGDRNNQKDIVAFTTAGYSSIAGTVFDDRNRNGVNDSESGLPFWTAFIDTNSNGKVDVGEDAVITDAVGDYRFHGLEAGTYSVNIVPQAGWQRTAPLAAGGHTVTILADGSVISGKDFGEFQPLPDLVASGVSASPALVNLGAPTTVHWTVVNNGTAPATGSWQDAVFLSPTPTLGPGATLVKTVPYVGGLSIGGQYTGSAVIVPPAEGSWYAIVRTDRRNQVAEGVFGANKANNVSASMTALEVQVPALSLGVPLNDAFDNSSRDRYYKVTLEAGASLILSLSGSPPDATNRIFVRFGDVPTSSTFDVATPLFNGPNPSLAVPVQKTGTYYIWAHNGAGGPHSFALTASRPGAILLGASPGSVGNAGHVTIEVRGSDLPADAAFQLEGPGGTAVAVTVQRVSPTLAYATFDLTGKATGFYLLRMTGTSVNTTLSDAVEVKPGVGAILVTSLVGPSAVRADREYQFYVEYSNDGDADAVAPLLAVVSPTNTWMGLTREDILSGRNLQFLGASQDGPAGVLRPGSRYRVPVYFHTPGGFEEYKFELRVTQATDDRPTDWPEVRELLDESLTELADFPAIFARMQQQLGPSLGDLVKAMARNASNVPGGFNESSDFRSLLALEADNARAAVGTSIRGKIITDDLLVRVAGVTVVARNVVSGDIFTTESLNDGSFTFSEVTPGTYALTVEGAVVANSSTFDVSAGEAVTGVVIDAVFGAAIYGRVSSVGTGLPVAGALVQAIGDHGESYSVIADDDGRFRIVGLTGGNYDLVVRAGGRAQTLVEGLALGVDDLEQNLQMQPDAVISGSVSLESGGPTGGIVTVFVRATNGDARLTFTATGNGRVFAVRGLPAGTYDVQLSLEGYLPRQITNVTIAVGGRVNLGTIALSRTSSVSGMVTSSDPQVAAAGTVVGLYSGPTLLRTTLSNASGQYNFFNVEAGSYTIKAIEGGAFSTTASATVDSGNAVTGADLAIRPGGSITGNVTDPVTNQPLAGVPVQLFDGTGAELATSRSDVNGAFRFDRLAIGDYTVSLLLSGPASASNVTVSSLDPTPVQTADLRPQYQAVLSGKVLTDSGAPAANAYVALVSSGAVITMAECDEQGNYRFLVAQPGTYDLVASADNASFAPAIAVSVLAGETVFRDLTSGTASFTVHASDPSNSLAGVKVLLRRWVGGVDDVSAEVTLAANGIASFTNVDPGTYTVQIAGIGGRGVYQSATVAPGSSSIDVSLVAMSSLAGTITNGAGDPIADAHVVLTSASIPGLQFFAMTQMDGSYVVPQVVAGDYDLSVVAEGHTAIIQTDVSIAGTTTRNVALASSTGTVIGRVVDAASLAVAGGYVAVLTADGNLVGFAVTEPDGTFSINTASGSNLTVRLAPDGYAPVDVSNITAGAGTTDIGVMTLQAIAQDPVRPRGGGAPPKFAYQLDYVAQVREDIDKIRSALRNRLKKMPAPPSEDCKDKNCDSIYRKLKAEFDRQEFMADILQSAVESLDDIVGDLALAFAQDTANLVLMFAPYSKAVSALQGGWAVMMTAGQFFLGIMNTASDLNGALSQAAEGSFKHDITNISKFFNDAYTLAANNYALGSLGKLSNNVARDNALLGKFGTMLGVLNILAGNNPYQNTADAYDRVAAVREKLNRIQKEFDNQVNKVVRIHRDYQNCLARAAKGGHDCKCKPPEKCDTPKTPYPPGYTGGGFGGIARGAYDPNQIVGPGVGDRNWVGVQQGLAFKVDFENDPNKASAAAQDVIITLQLDSDLDWSTFRLGSMHFGSTTVEVPADLQSFQATVPAVNVDNTPLNVVITADLNLETGLVSWVFLSVDPLTGDVPLNVEAGFLPVNDSTRRGEGSVTYSVQAKADRPTGTGVTSQASIVFDTNAPIETNVIENTIDAGLPSGAVVTLPMVSTPNFTVSWAGVDLPFESGLSSFDVFVSQNGGPWLPWLTHATATAAVFEGELSTNYAFAAVAIDAAGNRSILPLPSSPQAMTRTPIFSLPVGTILEDARTATGVPVSTLLGNLMTDVDPGTQEGIAVTALVGNGKWELSKDGRTWKSLAGASESAAFLLTDTYQVRFLPAKDWNGAAGILFRGWDRTFGTAGGRAAIAAPDAGNPFTADGGYATITVTPVNDAPIMPARLTVPLLLPSPKSPHSPPAQPLSALVKYAMDVDGDVLGVAITAVTGDGAWEYSADGTSWTPFPVVSAKQALLLAPTDFVHFLPGSGATGQATFSFRAWDMSSGTAGTLADTSARGATAFSRASALAKTLINTEPTLSGNPVSLSMVQDPTTNRGFAVTSLIAGRIADDARSLQGVAIVGVTGGANGVWQVSLDAGKTWRPLISVTPSAALLLRAPDRLRFVPNDGFSGTNAATLTYKAWDRTHGEAGSTADVSVDAPGTFFSNGTLTATLSVSPVASRPKLGTGFPASLASFLPNGTPSTALVSSLLVSARGATGVAIVGSSGRGLWEFSADGANWGPVGTVSGSRGRLLGGNYLVRFTPENQAAVIGTLTVKTWDGTNGTAGQLATISGASLHFSSGTGQVTVSVNTAPVLAPGSPALPDILEDSTRPAGASVATLLGSLVTDPDPSALKGLALNGLTGSANGTWQYRIGGGRWLPVGNVTDSSSLLLRPSDRLRYLPNPNFNGQASVTFRAWDQTNGTSGVRVNATTIGGSSAFSSNVANAVQLVKPVNDAPSALPAYGTGKIHLPSVSPGNTSPAGVQVSALVANWIIDLDGDALGIAVTGLTTQGGQWEVDTGSGYAPLNGVSRSSSLLLKPTDRVRFVPASGFIGSAQLTFRAWDQTKGTAGAKASITSLGDSVTSTDLIAPVWVNTSPVLTSS